MPDVLKPQLQVNSERYKYLKIMFVTTLINRKWYKKYLLKRFPKPIGSNVNETIIDIEENPSLYGAFFEIYFQLCVLRQSNINVDFGHYIESANENIKRYQRSKYNICDRVKIREISLNEDEFKKAIIEIKNEFPSGLYKVSKRKGISKVAVFEKDELRLFKFQHKTGYKILNSFKGNEFIFYNASDVVVQLNKYVSDFIEIIDKFNIKHEVTNELLISLFRILILSSPFYFSSPHNLFYISGIKLNSIRKRLSALNFPYDLLSSGNYYIKPDFGFGEFRARPDFLIGNVIWEIKSGKKYLTTNDYLQCLTYLLFSKERKNVKEYGKIERLVLYYPNMNKYFVFNSNSYKLSKWDNAELKKILFKYK